MSKLIYRRYTTNVVTNAPPFQQPETMRVFNTRLNEKLSKQPNFKPQLKTGTLRRQEAKVK